MAAERSVSPPYKWIRSLSISVCVQKNVPYVTGSINISIPMCQTDWFADSDRPEILTFIKPPITQRTDWGSTELINIHHPAVSRKLPAKFFYRAWSMPTGCWWEFTITKCNNRTVTIAICYSLAQNIKGLLLINKWFPSQPMPATFTIKIKNYIKVKQSVSKVRAIFIDIGDTRGWNI